MTIEIGIEYKISDSIKKNFNSAEILTIIMQKGNIIQFSLDGKKGHGSMPLQHLNYLEKKAQLIPLTSHDCFLEVEQEEQIV